ncbi:MAG TPA: hypothetical protein VD813_08575 [Pseudonocardia sp.]|nr:hypothetical protein [Pseudonocardia sp.]
MNRPGPGRYPAATRLLDVARVQALGSPSVFLRTLAAAVLLVPAALVVAAVTDLPGTARALLLSALAGLAQLAFHKGTQELPFVVALGVTRRNAYAGTLLFLAVLATYLGLVLLALAQVERATGGWGLDVQVLVVGSLAGHGTVVHLLGYVAPSLAALAAGLLAAAVSLRWHRVGLSVLLGTGVALSAGLVAVLVALDDRGALGAFLAGTSTPTLLVAYPALVTLVLAVGGRLVVHRAAI